MEKIFSTPIQKQTPEIFYKKAVLKVNKSVYVYSKLYIPILLAACNNIGIKNVIKRVKSVKLLNLNSRGSDVSNFIGSDRKIAPYHLVVF